MSSPAGSTFDSDLERRIYEYVERTGAASPSDIRHHVRIDAGPSASKPARSNGLSTERMPMPVAQVREHLRTLEADEYLIEEDGKYRVALGDTIAAHTVEDGTITIRPARYEDRPSLASVIREVASEESYIVARTIAEAIDHEATVLRNNERHSRVFFVAEFLPNDGDDPTAADVEADGEIVGWVHLEGANLAELEHVAELTVGIDDAHRRSGIGERLLEHGLSWAANAGYEKVCQTLPATNENAIAFLESHGWDREAVHDRQYRIDGEYVDEALLATWL